MSERCLRYLSTKLLVNFEKRRTKEIKREREKNFGFTGIENKVYNLKGSFLIGKFNS